MDAVCYCVGCKKHPLHNKRNDFGEWATGFTGGFLIKKYDPQQASVNCFNPKSDAEDYYGDLWNDWAGKMVAYGDGYSVAFMFVPGAQLMATCGNEEHED